MSANDYASEPKQKENDRNELAALVAECYYTHSDYPNAIRFYSLLSDDWLKQDEVGGGRLIGDDEGGRDTVAGTILTVEELCRHEALSYENLGNKDAAQKAIRLSLDLMKKREDDDPKIIADYHRIDASNIARVQAAAAAEQKRNVAIQRAALAKAKAEDAKQIKVLQAQERARIVAFANVYGGDRRAVALRNGIPCRTSSSSNSLGKFDTWYYGCSTDNDIGDESFTFRNGKLIDHSSW
jgi:hypothetical protein